MNFSKHLKRYYNAKTAFDAIKNMRSSSADLWLMRDHHIVTDAVVQDGEYFTNSEYIQKMVCNKKYIDVIIWINKNIVSQLDIDNYITTGVKLRIATGMIFKNCGQDATLMHLALVHNVNEVRAELIDEELPF